MFKIDYFEIEQPTNESKKERIIAKKVEKIYKIKFCTALNSLKLRNKMGTTQIANHFYLPHIETKGLEQGLILIKGFDQYDIKQTILVMVVNNTRTNHSLAMALQNLLTPQGLEQLEKCHDIQRFKNLIREAVHNVRERDSTVRH